MRNAVIPILTILFILSLFSVISAQDVITRPTQAPEETITIVNPHMNVVHGDNIISGVGNNTITLWDRSK